MLYHVMRHEHIESIVVAGLLPGSIGGGRNRRVTYSTMQDPWRSRNPISGLRGGVGVVVVVDAEQCITGGMLVWTNPSRTMRSQL